MVEGDGFDPPEPYGSTVFKTAVKGNCSRICLIERMLKANGSIDLPGFRVETLDYMIPIT